MRSYGLKVVVFVALGAGIFLGPPARAQNAPTPSLLDQLHTQYKLTRIGTEGTAIKILDPGTVLVIQKGGILGANPTNMLPCPTTFDNGNLKAPNPMCKAMIGQNGRFLDNGEKVYVTKIDIDLKKEKVNFGLIECDSCNGVQDASSYKATVAFQFPKGYLENADVGQVADTVGLLLTVDSGGNAQQPAPAAAAPAPDPAPAPAAPPPAAAPIQKGQTIDEVQANTNNGLALVADLGDKKIYQYNGLKITFVKGKVVDVQ
jgi:hypothetical protein